MESLECLEETYYTYNIRFGNNSFKYFLYNNELNDCTRLLNELNDIESFVIIADKNVADICGQSLVEQISKEYKCDLILFECTEKNKSLDGLQQLIEKVLLLKATRRTCIIGLGGGICGNISGMVASLLFRGLKFVHIPTTLMAILDSVLSLKQAINSKLGKNLIGTFYTPDMVITSTQFLSTLPNKEVISGLCEVIKNSLTILPETITRLLDMLNSECIYSWQDYRYFIDMSIQAKEQVMKNDPFEINEGLILEYGHTIGHAIELADARGISHGEAVGLGMLCAARISHTLGYLSEQEVYLHKELLEKAGAPTIIPAHIDSDTIMSIMKFDNKRGYISNMPDTVQLLLLGSIGKPLKNQNGALITLVPEEIVIQEIKKMYS